MTKAQKADEYEEQIANLTADLQRTRADFENYRKRIDAEKAAAVKSGEAKAILKLLPVIDTIERAVTHMPAELADHKWAQGVAGVAKQLDRTLEGLGLKRIDANPGTIFDPEIHEAIQFDEDATGEKEVVAEELQAGYLLGGTLIRHAMVKVTRQ
jgi:molecular chaperone GrpE